VKQPEPPPAKPEPAKPEPSASEASVDFEGQLGMLEAKVGAEANAFELFGLGPDADRKQIREVWAELSKRFHPDALEAHARGHLRNRVEPVFAALSEAYGVLSDKDQREKLREAILAGGSKVKASDDASIVVRNAIEAEMLARDADKLLRGSSWEKARDIYARAHELSPSDPDIEAALIYARHMAGSRDAVSSRVAITALAQVIQLAPGCSRACYFAGMIHLQLDESEPAKLRFVDALKADARNVDAERQLRALKIKERASGPAPSPDKPDDKKLGGLAGLRGLFGGGGKK
jgi:tetratricopeptide (TPR) repeat protein